MRNQLALLLFLSPCLFAETYTCGAKGHSAKEHGQALTSTTLYTPTTVGFDLGMPPERSDTAGCSSSKTFFVSAPSAEGNYTVTVVLGGSKAAVTTVRAESRRLMLMKVMTTARRYHTESFVVNVRRPEVAGGGMVKRKPREIGALDWDEKLTLEFSGENPSLRSIRIEPADPAIPTVYLAGDSTVVDQDKEPWAAWGQMLPAFFGPGVAIANHAESGETIRSFVGEQRFAKIFSLLKRGDYLFFQFAHNDQKPRSGNVPPEMYAGLLRQYIAMARERGATPVLVTSMNRRTYDSEGHVTDTLAPYPQTMRSVAESEHVSLIDLNAMSKTLYEAVGEPDSRSLFVYAAANTYPGQAEALHDDTHFNSFGAYELARCIVLGIEQDKLPLAAFLRNPRQGFDPSHPDPAASISLPQTPFADVQTPYGR